MRIRFWKREPVYFMEFDLPSGAVQSKKRIYSLADLKVPIPPPAAVRIVRGLAEGIDYIHRQGVRHYLLEPSVIFLDMGLNPKISGFDTAALVQTGIPEGCWVAAPEQHDPETLWKPWEKN
jgi:serine/threonine protein kinase